MNKNFDEIELKLIQILDNVLTEADKEKYTGDSMWTRRIKECIGAFGHEQGYEVAAGGCNGGFESEWLFDLVWYEEDEKNRLVRIPLIVESEWNKDYRAIKYDFEKLLVGNAERRLMICQAYTENVEGLFVKLEEAIVAFKENYGDRFLIVIYDCRTWDTFHYRTFTKQSIQASVIPLS